MIPQILDMTLERVWRFSAGLIVFILCVAASSVPATAQPMPAKPSRWMQTNDKPPLSRGWDYDGKRILGHVGDKLLLWDATTGKLLHKMKLHKERIFVVQFSPDGVHALSNSWMPPGPMVDYKSKDTRTILWNLETGDNKVEYQGAIAGEFSPDGKRIVTFSAGANKLSSFDAAVWDAFSGVRIADAKLGSYGDPLLGSLHFSSDGHRLAVVSQHGATLYDAKDGHQIARATEFPASGHRYTSEGAYASFGLKDVTLTDIESGKVLRNFAHNLKLTFRAAWTHDGKKVAAFPGDESEIKIWDVDSGQITTGAKCGPYPHQCALVSPDNRFLAVEWGGANGVEPGLGIYDMNSGKEIARTKIAEWGHLVGFSPDSKTVLVGGTEFVIYDSENGKMIRTLKLLDDVSFEYDWNR